jgi:small conductance mechanosensitive channel
MSDVGASVLRGLVATLDRLVAGFGARLPLFVVAVLVVLVAWWLGRVVFSITRKVLARTSTAGHVDLLVARFAKAGVITVGLVVALSVVGVNLGALVASLGLVGLTISLALKDVLANYVSGVMLLLQGPFKVGDTIVVDGIEGTVTDVTARSTALRSGDGRIVHIPNMTVFGATVTNVTAEPVRRFEISLTVPADGDLASGRGVVLAAVTDVKGVLPDPAADAQVATVGAAWARVVAHGWVDTRVASLGDVQAAALVVAGRRLHEAGLSSVRRRLG